jgi:hypothetical protein
MDIYYNNINYDYLDEKQNIEDEINYKCAICFESIKDLEQTNLNKLCTCADSLVCNDCLLGMEQNNIKKCPVCRSNLNYNVIKRYIFDIKTFVKYYKNIFFFIICNVIIYNTAIFLKYFNDDNEYPNITNSYYDSLFILNNQTILDIRNSEYNYNICKNSIIFKKSPYFIITNLFINFLFPITFGINNSISLYKYQNDIISTKINVMIMYMLTILNMINISMLCIIKQNIDYIQLLLLLNIILYGLLFVGSCMIYLFVYFKLFNNNMINTNMIEDIKYNIIAKIFLNSLQTTDV